MSKPKPTATRKIAKPKTAARKSVRARKVAAPPRAPTETHSEEYADYLERFEIYGAGRPQLSPAEFDRLDDEMLDLLDQEFTSGLTDEQIVRLQELEYLLIDSEQ